MKVGGSGDDVSTIVCRLLPLAGLVAVTACKPPPDTRWETDRDAVTRGREAIVRVQCAACHVIPGIDWPSGRTGPSLAEVGQDGTIAGSLPNRPDVLAAFVRNAPAVKPGSPMPPMPINEAEARDIAAYLQDASR